MRIGFSALLAAAAISMGAQQAAVSPADIPSNFSIPAQLNTTIRAEKAHVGDVVKFTTVEPVLIAKGVVMPGDTKLYGRVLGAAPRQGQTPSWVSVVVDRAEWKQHSLPLHAFISGQIAASVFAPSRSIAAEPDASNRSLPDSPRGRHYSLGDPKSAIAMGRSNDAATWDRESNMPATHYLSDIKLARQKSGVTFLFSEKHNLKLSNGILFMLQNTPAQTGATATPTAIEQK